MTGHQLRTLLIIGVPLLVIAAAVGGALVDLSPVVAFLLFAVLPVIVFGMIVTLVWLWGVSRSAD